MPILVGDAHGSRTDSPAAVVPPRPTPGPVGLVAFDSHVDPLAFLGSLIEQYGDVVRYQTRFGPCILFVHPQHVHTILHRENYRRASLVKMMLGEGLLASDGNLWRSQRRLMQPDFLPARVAPLMAVVTNETTRTAATWRDAAREGQPVDLTAAMTRLTLRIVVRALFSDDLSEEKATALCEAITQTLKDLGNISWTIFGVPARFTPNSNATFTACKQVIDGACYDMIARRRAMPAADRPADLLTLLIDADSENSQPNDRQLRDEIVTMLVGGHETTAIALAWAWQALGDNPDIEERLLRELTEVLAGRAPNRRRLSKPPLDPRDFSRGDSPLPPSVVYGARRHRSRCHRRPSHPKRRLRSRLRLVHSSACGVLARARAL